MAEQLVPTDEYKARDPNSFVYYFDFLYAELKMVEDTKSPEYMQKAEVIRDYLLGFWRKKLTEISSKSGSFGRNKNGDKQPANCMDILNDRETTICKWGMKMDDNGASVPRLEVLSTPHPEGFHKSLRSHTYTIELNGNTLNIERANR